jgi:hypothetical protein
MEVNSNFYLSSDHTPVIATISNTVINVNKIPSLHNKKTNCQTYTKLIEVKLNLKISLKTSEELERETNKKIDWLLGRKSHLNLENKILVYKVAIKPIWTYGIELWGCASKSNTDIIQRLQSKILRAMTNAPWYVSNDTP